MDLTNFSLIYPDASKYQESLAGAKRPNISMFALEEMGFLEVFDLKNSTLSDFFTNDTEVLAYRNEVFSDLLENPSLVKMIWSITRILSNSPAFTN